MIILYASALQFGGRSVETVTHYSSRPYNLSRYKTNNNFQIMVVKGAPVIFAG